MSEPTESHREEATPGGRAGDVMSELDRETDREILEILVGNSPLRVMDIAKMSERHPITVDQTCDRLHQRGYLYPLGRGLYEVTDDGRRRFGDSDGT